MTSMYTAAVNMTNVAHLSNQLLPDAASVCCLFCAAAEYETTAQTAAIVVIGAVYILYNAKWPLFTPSPPQSPYNVI